MKFWKMSPGRNARYWRDFRDQSIMAIGWLEEIGDLSKIDNYEKIKKLAIEQKNSQNAINQTWNFYKNVDIDHIVVAFGKSSILDIGRVTGEYYFDNSEENYFHDGYTYVHRRKVQWFNLFDRPLRIDDDEKLYNALRWPQDSIHEITDEEVKQRIRDFVSKRGVLPSEEQIFRTIERLREKGKFKINKDKLFESLAFEVEEKNGQKLRSDWQSATWEKIKELAEEVIE